MGAEDLRDLKRAAGGNLEALHRVMPLVYEHARHVAGTILAADRARHWVRASSLVNLAYLRLIEHRRFNFDDEAKVIAALVRIMRRVIVDVVRRETALKRGGHVSRVGLHADGLSERRTRVDAIELEDAMEALAAVCNESARVAELRLWGGMELEQIAAALDMPLSRVRSRWNRAKAWLTRELGEARGETAACERGSADEQG